LLYVPKLIALAFNVLLLFYFEICFSICGRGGRHGEILKQTWSLQA